MTPMRGCGLARVVLFRYSMSFGFRKGFSSGPFRMTFSKSGLSMSVGAGGARLTAGPRGTRVSFSQGGFYYRTRLDTPGRSRMNPQPSPLQREAMESIAPPVPSPAEAPATVSSQETFGDVAPDAVIEAMNRRIKRRNLRAPRWYRCVRRTARSVGAVADRRRHRCSGNRPRCGTARPVQIQRARLRG